MSVSQQTLGSCICLLKSLSNVAPPALCLGQRRSNPVCVPRTPNLPCWRGVPYLGGDTREANVSFPFSIIGWSRYLYGGYILLQVVLEPSLGIYEDPQALF